MAKWRGNARHDGALDQRTRSSRRPAGRQTYLFEVSGITFDSREVEPGHLFVAMPGTAHDGHAFVAKAFELGAVAALVSKPVDGPHVLVVRMLRMR